MDELIIKEYNNSEASFNNAIKSNVPIIICNYWYLIKENWFNKISNLINYKNNNISLVLKNEQPEFLEDISSILDCLSNKIKIKFISIKLLELIYDENILKNHNQVLIYSGNNKVIISYKEKQDNVLLLINPLENISQVLLISIINKLSLINEKNQLYKELLNKEQLNLDKIYKKYNKIIFNYKDYSDIYSNNSINNFENDYIKKRIDIRYKKDKKNNLNRSMEMEQSDFSTNKILIEKNIIKTLPNDNAFNKNYNQFNLKKIK